MKRKISKILLILTGLFLATIGHVLAAHQVQSPNGELAASFEVNDQGVPVFSVTLSGKEVIKTSELGLLRSDESFYSGLTLQMVSEVEKISDDYRMFTGKRKDCQYRAIRRMMTLKNADGVTLRILFQVSDDGVAFRYVFPDKVGQEISIIEEKSAFAFPSDTRSWLHPMAVTKSGWSRTQPSYEEHYTVDPIGEPSPYGQGWCFPALFKSSGDVWVLICETDVDENYCGTHLAHDSDGGIYRIAFPQPQGHRGPVDPVAPATKTPFQSPWRVLIIGRDLGTLVESTLMTDLTEPCTIENTDFIKPGRAAWHWLRYGDESATLEYAESFLDFAAKMKWEYMLVDANWDRLIGYEKMTEFVKKARSKNVGVILWYNSNGPWNDAPMTPKNKMHERDVRRKEFALLHQMGVTGVKVDFFGGDKQATMKLYRDICADAADYEIMVNFHGATIPRGWQRTYPNLMSMESVKGMEYCTFEQRNADLQAQHCTILPFTRNVIGSMDFTPVVFNPHIRSVTLKTTSAFELALSVIFESGIQHFGLVPEEYALMPDYVVSFLQKVPTAWDRTHFVDGYPGQFVVMARQKENAWYVGGINGTDEAKTLTPDLSFISDCQNITLITDGSVRSFIQKSLDNDNVKNLTLDLKPHGGFVILAE